MRILTAGESHGRGLVGILDGVPAHFDVSKEEIDSDLRRRQGGYGRGGRMKIESDTAEVYSGLRGGCTLGSPIAVIINNRDYANWQQYTDPFTGDRTQKALTAVRPGHADLAGCIKYDSRDARMILERASARETAMRVALGSVCRQILAQLGVTVASRVTAIGGVRDETPYGDAASLRDRADKSEVRALDESAAKEMMKVIDGCRAKGDTAGGEVQLVAAGMPVGVGSHTQSDKRLDCVLSGRLAAIQAVKYVAVGDAAILGEQIGSRAHDKMYPSADGKIVRKTNLAGGIEGGISNGEDIVVRLGIKPIPTLMAGLDTVDIVSGKPCRAASERSDVCAVPAAGVVAEAVAAYALLDMLLECTGGDTKREIQERVRQMRSKEKLF